MAAAGWFLSGLRSAAPVSVLILLAIGVSCGTGEEKPAGSALTQADPLARFDENQHGWTVNSAELNVVLATPDLGVGSQRFALVLSDSQGLIKFPVVEFSSYRYPDGFSGEREGPFESQLARFAEFPFGTRGIHVTELEFPLPGDWAVVANVPRPDGSAAVAEVRFEVLETPRSVAVGDMAPPSLNRTLADETDVSRLTTGSFYDEELYRYTVAEAIDRNRPFVVVFASPAFCTNAVCGPQVEVISELRQVYGESVGFIHIDLFENPHEIQGDLSRAVESPVLDEWGLISPEWTFVVGSDGSIVARFENFAGASEISEAIESVMRTSNGS